MEKMSAKQGVVVEIDDDHDADVDDAGSVGGGVDQANDSLTEEDCPDHHNRGKTIKTPHSHSPHRGHTAGIYNNCSTAGIAVGQHYSHIAKLSTSSKVNTS